MSSLSKLKQENNVQVQAQKAQPLASQEYVNADLKDCVPFTRIY